MDDRAIRIDIGFVERGEGVAPGVLQEVERAKDIGDQSLRAQNAKLDLQIASPR